MCRTRQAGAQGLAAPRAADRGMIADWAICPLLRQPISAWSSIPISAFPSNNRVVNFLTASTCFQFGPVRIEGSAVFIDCRLGKKWPLPALDYRRRKVAEKWLLSNRKWPLPFWIAD